MRSGKLLIRVAVIIAIWHLRSAVRVKRHVGGLALRAVGHAATGLGLVLQASLRLVRLQAVFHADLFERETFEPDSFGMEVAVWASSQAVNRSRLVR
ncbi:MAG TPA: hypothetical protein VG675_13195 [Bryobacteraceae bacterium]|nr:hypothetical protein [Bryobacteraceae bacterium]